MATHSSILAWEMLWIEQPAWLQTMGSQSPAQLNTHTHTHTLVYLFACLVTICFGCAGPSFRHLGPVVAMLGPRCSV